MSYSIVSNSGKINYGVKHLTVDNEDDVFYLGVTAQPGSTIYCIDTQSKYIMNTRREWVKQSNSALGDDDIIYEGGDSNNESTDTSNDNDDSEDFVYEGGRP